MSWNRKSVPDNTGRRRRHWRGNAEKAAFSGFHLGGQQPGKKHSLLEAYGRLQIAVLQTDAVNSISSSETKNEILSSSNRLPATFSSEVFPGTAESTSPQTTRQGRLRNFAGRGLFVFVVKNIQIAVHSSLGQSPTRGTNETKSQSTIALPPEYFDVVIFDRLDEIELIGLVPVDKYMDRESRSNKSGKKRARFVEDDSIGSMSCCF